MGLTRRDFLRQVGVALATLGVSEIGLSLMAERFQQVLAQPTRRKLALLVGINQYSESVGDRPLIRGSALHGCLTDVDLQRELLIHRFGFQPSDILTLTDQQATRQTIESAFQTHLTEQARSGDVVLFHFSGFGSQVQLEDGSIHNSLVPVDGELPSEAKPLINDIMIATLALLVRSLATDQVTTILDTSYLDPDGILQGNLRIRARPSTPSGQLHPAELALQHQLHPQQLTSEQLSFAQWPGVVLTAANPQQGAAEGQWNGFSAGLFTYALTQQLWWAMPTTTLRVDFREATSQVTQQVGEEQQPQVLGQKLQATHVAPYFLPTEGHAAADGVVTMVEEDGKTAQVWLGGVPAVVLEHLGANSLLYLEQLQSSTADPVANGGSSYLQTRSREGLTLRARLLTGSATHLQIGQLVREAVRVLPRNVGLTIALDNSLERIERVDATSAFAAIAPKAFTIVAGDQSSDYLFGKARLPGRTLASVATEPLAPETNPAPVAVELKGGYGLFNLGRGAIPNTLVGGDEAVKTAVHRITPQLRTLLANKLLRLTANQGTSQLGVRATLEMVSPLERIVLQQETGRASAIPPVSKLAPLFVAGGEAPDLPINSRIQYRLLNYGDRPLYFMLLGLDSLGRTIALRYNASSGNISEAQSVAGGVIEPGEMLKVPHSPLGAEWAIQGPIGLTEVHLVCCTQPFSQTLIALEAGNLLIGGDRQIVQIANPLDVAYAIMQDLHNASIAAMPQQDVVADTYVLNVNVWATLNFFYRIVA